MNCNLPATRLVAFTLTVGLITALPCPTISATEPATLEAPASAKNSQAKPIIPKHAAWIRIHRDKKKEPVAMQTAVVRYKPMEGASDLDAKLRVDLIGAVHVGDRSYYRALNRRFKQYDALLYEMVAPKGAVIEKGRGTSNAHPIGAMQNGMKAMLGLVHQLAYVDYQQKNFVHADMSPEEMSKSMTNRGESFMQMYFRMIGSEMARQSGDKAKGSSAEMAMLFALFSSDRDRKLKIALAEQFENVDTLMAGLSGPDGSTLITERNKVAFKVLREQIELGRQKIGIFYGAGHLQDMHERMKKDFQMEPVSVEWIDAWNLRAKK